MRTTIIGLAFCLVGVIPALAQHPNPKWQNALKPQGAPAAEMVLARNGQALYAIVTPSPASGAESKAAADLAEWLGKMTGAKFEVMQETSLKPGQMFISVGNTRLAKEVGVVPCQTDLKEEGYVVEAKDGNLYLAGGSGRGPINAVYALLEEDLGCRWYSRTADVIPRLPVLKLSAVPRVFVPALEIRDPYYFDAFDGTWSLRNRTNSPSAIVPKEWGGNMAYALFVHTFAMLVPPDTYFKDHPEYFSENDGKRNPNQLCVSNPEVLKIAIESVKRKLREHPEARIISVSQNDSAPCCACALCKAEANKEGSLAGPLLKFVNGVADAVKDEFPNVRISTLAYLDTVVPPQTIRPRPNVAIQLCTDKHAWSEPFLTVEETQTFQSAMKAWAAAGANINIWDYTCNFSHYAAPMPNWQVVTDSIRFFVDNGASGVMLQGDYQSFGTSDGPMRCWVWAKQLWDPKLDTRMLMRDFVYGYYGRAANDIWHYQEQVWDLWEREHHGRLKSPAGGIRYEMNLFDSDFMKTAGDCFARAEAAAENPEILQRVEEAELQILYVRLCQAEKVGPSAEHFDLAGFNSDLDKLERIARREKVTHLREGTPDLEDFLARMREVAKG